MRRISTILWICFIGVWLVIAGFSIYIRMANPDMTEARLFLTYWKEYLGMIVIALSSQWAAYRFAKWIKEQSS